VVSTSKPRPSSFVLINVGKKQIRAFSTMTDDLLALFDWLLSFSEDEMIPVNGRKQAASRGQTPLGSFIRHNLSIQPADTTLRRQFFAARIL
jgi:hypothetical protein